MSPRLQFALDVVYQAGRSTLGLFGTHHEVALKSDQSPVTAADTQAEAIIRKAIAENYPGEGILGEEEGESGPASTRWVLDPIDGTKSFICGVPLYATLLSFELEGLPQLGVCYFPALDQMVWAESGEGTYCNGRACRVSTTQNLSKSVLCCGSHFSMDKHGRALGFLELAKQAMTTRTWGDAYGHALVAMGRVEAMVDPVVQRWDVSAMQIILSEAGGKMTGFDGSPNPSNQAVSSNGLLHAKLLEHFQ